MAEKFKFKNFIELPVVLDLKDKEGNKIKELSYNMTANINFISYYRPGIIDEELSANFTMVSISGREFPVVMSYEEVKKLMGGGMSATLDIDGSTHEPWMDDP